MTLPDRRTFLCASAAALGPLAAIRQRLFDRASSQGGVESLEYTLDPAVTYLNHGSIGTIPKRLQASHAEYLATCESNPWLYMWGGAWEAAREDTRAKAATLLGCNAEEVILNHSTTEGFSLLASGLPLGSGDEVLFSSRNHPGASVAWEVQAGRRGFEVRSFKHPPKLAANETKEQVVAHYAEHIGPKTRVLALPHIDNIVGARHPVAEIAAMAKERGVEFVAVDGAQAVGMIPVDMAALGVDFYCTSPHKWLQAPKGLGLMYLARDAQLHLHPHHATWGQNTWRDSVRRFEDYGTRNLPALLTLGDAIALRLEAGFETTNARQRELRDRFRTETDARENLHWNSSTDWQSGASLFSIEIHGENGRDAARRLWEKHRVVARGFASPDINAIRVSPNSQSADGDVERFFTALG